MTGGIDAVAADLCAMAQQVGGGIAPDGSWLPVLFMLNGHAPGESAAGDGFMGLPGLADPDAKTEILEQVIPSVLVTFQPAYAALVLNSLGRQGTTVGEAEAAPVQEWLVLLVVGAEGERICVGDVVRRRDLPPVVIWGDICAITADTEDNVRDGGCMASLRHGYAMAMARSVAG